MELCVYHENKMTFETMRRHLVRYKVFPRDLSKRLAMSVCSCRQKRTTKVDLSNQDFHSMKESIKSFFNKTTETRVSMSSLEVIHNLLHTEASLTTSEKYLVYILHKALENDYSLLEKEKPNWKKCLEKATEVNNDSDEKQYAMSTKQINLMVKKRKRKMPVSSCIDFPIPGYKLYLLTRKTGRDLKDVARKFRCYFEIDWATTNYNTSVGTPISRFKAWCRTQESLAEVKQYFDELLTTKEFLDYKLVGQEHILFNDGKIGNSSNREVKMNYCLTDHFTEKVLGRKKTNNRYVTSRQRVKSLPSALSSVLCERCLQSYSDVLVQNRPCYFHLANRGSEIEAETTRKWSCCDSEDQGLPLVEEHQNSGCWKGSHIWNTCDVITKPANHSPPMHSRPKQKLKWAVVGYVKAF